MFKKLYSKLYILLFVRKYHNSLVRLLYPKRYKLSNSSIVSKHRMRDSLYLLKKINARLKAKAKTEKDNETC